MNQNNYPPAVVLGLSPTGLAVARNLGRKGIKVYGVDHNSWTMGRFSKYIKSFILSDDNWEEELFDHLMDLESENERKMVLFCADDSFLFFLAKYVEKLKQKFLVPNSINKDLIMLLLDKEKFYKMCIREGIEIPQTYFPKNKKDIEHISEKINFPCVIKPALPHMWRERFKGKKMIFIDNLQDLYEQFNNLSTWDGSLIIQEVIPGQDDLIYISGVSMNKYSEPLVVFTGRKLRQFPPRFGSASLAVSQWDPDVAKMSINLLKKINFHGVCGVEYKKDPRDGRFKMIEINLRPVLWFSLIEASGLDIIFATYEELLDRNESKYKHQKDGIKWIYSARDMVSSFYYIYNRELGFNAWFKSILGPKTHAVFAKDDLKTILFYPFVILYELWHYLVVGES